MWSSFLLANQLLSYDGQEAPVYGLKNNDRFPDYHRLDVSATFKLNKDPVKFEHALIVSIYNLYGRRNPVFINFNKTMDGEENIVIPGNLFGARRIASQTYYYGFIPSVAYYFKFL